MKRFLAAVLSAMVLASTAFAGPDPDETKNIGRFGHTGLWNTLSAQTLGYSRLSLNVYSTQGMSKDFVKNYYFWEEGTVGSTRLYKYIPTQFDGGNYTRATINLSAVYGLTRFLDLGLMLPIYVDNMGEKVYGGKYNDAMKRYDHTYPDSTLGDSDNYYTQGGPGDLEISAKFLYPPYPHRKFFQMSYYGAISIPTSAKDWGHFPRQTYYQDKRADIYYINTEDASNSANLKSLLGVNEFFGSGQPEIDMKMLWTWDFREMSDFFPVLFHVNYGLRWTLQYRNDHIFYLNSGLEVRPADWISVFLDFSAAPRFGSIQQDETFRLWAPQNDANYREYADHIEFFPKNASHKTKRSMLDDPIRLSPGVAVLTPIGITASVGVDISLAHQDGFYFGNQNTSKSSERDENDNFKNALSYVLIETAVEPKVSLVASIGWNGLTVQSTTVVPDAPILAPDCDTVRLVDTVFVDKVDTVKVEVTKAPVTYTITASVAAGQGTISPVGVNVVNEGSLATYTFTPAQGFSIEQVTVNGINQGAVAQYTFPSVRSAQVITVSFKQDPIIEVVEVAPVAFEIPRDGLVLRGVNFQSGKAILTAASYGPLDDVIKSLRQWPEIKLEVQGHTDSVGKRESNMRLSKDRANTVMKYFIQNGIPHTQLRAVGYGPDMPIADNDTDSGRELNRRVTLVPFE
ncbi:MAG: OmpA family protein [Chitinivibrionia bacterium]|nr:OmpA family protein [Chitinivibrionia bacterium]